MTEQIKSVIPTLNANQVVYLIIWQCKKQPRKVNMINLNMLDITVERS